MFHKRVDRGSGDLKEAVRRFWQRSPCGSAYLDGSDYDGHSRLRYELEPFIADFAGFSDCAGKKILEIGVGLGADHLRFAAAGADLTGIDLSSCAVRHTHRRLAEAGFESNLQVADAEALPFDDESFDFVYSWGVLHHSPDTGRAIDELFRVLRPGGRFAVMIYNRRSIVGLILWLRYGLPFGRSLDQVLARYLESPGTKAFTVRQAQEMFRGAQVETALSPGDLLSGAAGRGHSGPLLWLGRLIWPRRFIRRRLGRYGLFLMIRGTRPTPREPRRKGH